MKFRFLQSLCTLAALALFSGIAFAAPVKTIGIVMDGPLARFENIPELFKEDIRALTAGEFEVRFPADKQVHGNWNPTEIGAALKAQLADPEIDVVLALGYGASNLATAMRPLKKPVFAPFVIGEGVQDLPAELGKSGVDNLSYSLPARTVENQLLEFRKLAPIKHLGILVDPVLLDSVPDIEKKARKLGYEFSIEISLIPVAASVPVAVSKIPAGVDAVIIAPLLQLSAASFADLTLELIKRKLASYSLWGAAEVEAGLLMGAASADEIDFISRTTALHMLDVFKGINAGQLSVSYASGSEPTINMVTARALGVYPGWALATEARLFDPQEFAAGRTLSLDQAVGEALKGNRDLVAFDRFVAAGEGQVKEARGFLLPQLDLNANYRQIDKDRAESSLGREPEKTVNGQLTFSQSIYSDKIWTGYSVAKYAQMDREEGRRALELDIVEATAIAYFDVLRAKNIERIQKSNLQLTRANLERAQVREAAGSASPAEIYRWETEIANSRQTVLAAETVTLSTMQDLNRIMNRPLNEVFVPVESEYTDPLSMIGDKRLFRFFDNELTLQLFRKYLVEKGLESSPELSRLNAQISAKQRVQTSVKRDFWLPKFSLQASAEQRFDESGAGSNGLLSNDDSTWSAGVFATLPLLEGGSRLGSLQRSSEEVSQLREQRNATAERVEQRVQLAVNLLRTSYPSISLSRSAADAADNNLQLVRDSYVEGIYSIIDLLDAQTLALATQQKAANASFDFLIDLYRAQRAVGENVALMEESERSLWLDDAEAYYHEAGVRLGEGH